MEKIRNRKDWIKNAIIIFLIVMLVLTFCSDSIMNMYLPEVSTEAVTSGKLQEVIRGSGNAELTRGYQVKIKESRTIRLINVKVGQNVKKGDVLFTLEPSDGNELENAKNTFLEIQTEYQKKLLGANYNYDKETLAIKAAKEDYDRAVENLNSIDKKTKEVENKQKKLASYDKKISNIETKIAKYESDISELSAKTDATSLQADLLAKQRLVVSLQYELADIDADLQALKSSEAEQADIVAKEREKRDKGVDIANAQNDVVLLERDIKKIDDNVKELEKAKTNKDKATVKLNEYKIRQTSLSAEIEVLKAAIPNKAEAEAAVQEKENSWNNLIAEYEGKKDDDSLTQESDKIEINALKQKLISQKKIVEEIMASSLTNEIKAEQEGMVASISAAPGDITQPDTSLCVIASAEDGFEVKVSVTKEQAAKIKVGQNADIENYWFGGDVTAVVASITADTENPANSTIKFAVSGEHINEGDSISLSVGGESKSYDLIVPKSSIYEDNNGKFVLTLDSKNTPLGNRYIVTRHDVEVLAQNDTNAAISTDLVGYEYVIIAASEALTPGEQVKLKE